MAVDTLSAQINNERFWIPEIDLETDNNGKPKTFRYDGYRGEATSLQRIELKPCSLEENQGKLYATLFFTDQGSFPTFPLNEKQIAKVVTFAQENGTPFLYRKTREDIPYSFKELWKMFALKLKTTFRK